MLLSIILPETMTLEFCGIFLTAISLFSYVPQYMKKNRKLYKLLLER